MLKMKFCYIYAETWAQCYKTFNVCNFRSKLECLSLADRKAGAYPSDKLSDAPL